MKEIFEQLALAFDNNVDLSATFPSGLFNDIGYDNQILPVAIISGISNVTTWTTCDVIHDLRVQFTVYTTTDTECFDVLDLIFNEYNDKKLTLLNSNPIILESIGSTPPRKIDDAWRGTIDFNIKTHKSR